MDKNLFPFPTTNE